VRVTGGTVVSTEDQSQAGTGGNARFIVTIAPDGTASSFTIEIDFSCGDAIGTRRFQATYATPLMYGDTIFVQAL
jgi:hypothetical protein